jgi:hypothetical protein
MPVFTGMTGPACLRSSASRRYYEQYGFTALSDSPLKLFLPLATLKQALARLD